MNNLPSGHRPNPISHMIINIPKTKNKIEPPSLCHSGPDPESIQMKSLFATALHSTVANKDYKIPQI